MKKITGFLLALLLTLSACGAPPVAPPADHVTLNVVTSYGGDDGNRRNFEAAVAAYEAATGNTVKDGSAKSDESWKRRVETDFETGSEPDILFYFTNADADMFINAGKVVSIQEIREVYPDYASNMKESMMAVAADGASYAVPSYGFWENMFVNRAVLDDCGIEIPGPDYTWDQFLVDCQTILDAGYTPIACSLYQVPHYWFEFTVMNNGTLENHLDVPKSVHDAAGRKWVAALNDIKDLYERRFFPANTLTARDEETVAMFAEGKAAFLIDGSWKCGYFADTYGDRLGDYVLSYVPAKGERAATEAIGGISMGYFITRRAWENPDKQAAAVEFVKTLTSDKVLSSFVTTEVTALKNGVSAVGLNAIQQSAANANAGLTGVVGAVQDTISKAARESLFADVQRVVTGELTAEEAVAAAIALNETGN